MFIAFSQLAVPPVYKGAQPDNSIEGTSLASQVHTLRIAAFPHAQPSESGGPELLGAAPVDLAPSPMLFSLSGSEHREVASLHHITLNATGRTPPEIASLQSRIASPGKSLISACRA